MLTPQGRGGRRFQLWSARVNERKRDKGAAMNNNNVAATQPARSSLLNDNLLHKPEDAQNRPETYKEFHRFAHEIRREKDQTTSKYANYQWSSLIVQVIRSRYPSDIKKKLRE